MGMAGVVDTKDTDTDDQRVEGFMVAFPMTDTGGKLASWDNFLFGYLYHRNIYSST